MFLQADVFERSESSEECETNLSLYFVEKGDWKKNVAVDKQNKVCRELNKQ